MKISDSNVKKWYAWKYVNKLKYLFHLLRTAWFSRSLLPLHTRSLPQLSSTFNVITVARSHFLSFLFSLEFRHPIFPLSGRSLIYHLKIPKNSNASQIKQMATVTPSFLHVGDNMAFATNCGDTSTINVKMCPATCGLLAKPSHTQGLSLGKTCEHFARHLIIISLRKYLFHAKTCYSL